MRAYNLQPKGEVYMIVKERGYELNIVQVIKDKEAYLPEHCAPFILN